MTTKLQVIAKNLRLRQINSLAKIFVSTNPKIAENEEKLKQLKSITKKMNTPISQIQNMEQSAIKCLVSTGFFSFSHIQYKAKNGNIVSYIRNNMDSSKLNLFKNHYLQILQDKLENLKKSN
jgi:hypothetical protein